MLCDGEILEEIEAGNIVIKPFRRSSLGTNSYDVHLGKVLARYIDPVLDVKKHHELEYFDIPDTGYILEPGKFYLGSTEEYTESHKHIPILDGKSSSGRYSISLHETAGIGDVGFKNHWTLEISVIVPVRVYAGMPIGQIIYFKTDASKIINSYDNKESAKYNERSSLPKESMLWKNFQ